MPDDESWTHVDDVLPVSQVLPHRSLLPGVAVVPPALVKLGKQGQKLAVGNLGRWLIRLHLFIFFVHRGR